MKRLSETRANTRGPSDSEASRLQPIAILHSGSSTTQKPSRLGRVDTQPEGVAGPVMLLSTYTKPGELQHTGNEKSVEMYDSWLPDRLL